MTAAALTQMTISVTDRSAIQHSITGEVGQSLMEAIRDGGIDDLMALCGGCLSCATCHVYVDEKPPGLLPTISGDEDDLLETSSYRQKNSRLSCQISLDGDMDGLSVTIAPED